MDKFLAGLLPLFWSSLALAVEAEQPIETSSTGIVIFFVACIACAVWFGWYLWKNEKLSDEQKRGEAF